MTPDFDTYLMDAYDRWCEDLYDTEGEYESDCTHDWEYLEEPFAETMRCSHCGVTQR